MKTQQTHALLVALASMATCVAIAACQEVADDPGLEGNLAVTAAYFAGAYDAESYADVEERVHNVLTNGAEREYIDCRNLATIFPGGLLTVKHFKAGRLQDGSCNAKVDLFLPLTGVAGLAQSSASELTGVGEVSNDADLCPVTSFGPAGVSFLTWIVGGTVHVEAPGCPSGGCLLPVNAVQCSGDLAAF